MDVSGVGDNSRFNLSCAYWRGGVVTGLAVSGHQVDGEEIVQTIQLLPCNIPRSVTCCDVEVAPLLPLSSKDGVRDQKRGKDAKE